MWVNFHQAVESSRVYLQSVVGTMLYMAPEFFPENMDESQIRYKKTVDIYSLAMVIYQVYTGAPHTEFYRSVQNVYGFIRNKSTGVKPAMRLLETGVPKSVATVIDRAVDKDPKQRPSLVEFAIAVACGM
jgi:serine/threonine protein kinase